MTRRPPELLARSLAATRVTSSPRRGWREVANRLRPYGGGHMRVRRVFLQSLGVAFSTHLGPTAQIGGHTLVVGLHESLSRIRVVSVPPHWPIEGMHAERWLGLVAALAEGAEVVLSHFTSKHSRKN